MPQQRLSNDEFLSSLTNLFTSTTTAAHGSVFLTQKPMPAANAAATSSQVLIRATNGAASPSSKAKIVKKSVPKVKLATVVEAADLDTFYAKYAEVCKKSMEGLRKRDKKKAKEKAKAAKKKKGGAVG